MIAIAATTGYLIGAVPTATWLGRLWGVDLRRDGSGNPGTNNARRLGGLALAIAVLLMEMTKGFAAVLAGLAVAGETGAVAAGLGAVVGNVYNIWYRFQGGKGLGITGGVLVGLWPVILPFAVLTIALASALTRSTGIGTLITLASLAAGAGVWARIGWENPWGLGAPGLLLVLALGLSLIIAPKHWRDAMRRLSSPAPR